jgi:hypothetical protein
LLGGITSTQSVISNRKAVQSRDGVGILSELPLKGINRKPEASDGEILLSLFVGGQAGLILSASLEQNRKAITLGRDTRTTRENDRRYD